MEVAEFRVSWWICSSVDHGMTSLRKDVWWRHFRRHSNIRLIVICGCNSSPDYCGWGFPFIRENTLCRWTGFTKRGCFVVFKQKSNDWIICMLLDMQPLTLLVGQETISETVSQSVSLAVRQSSQSAMQSVSRQYWSVSQFPLIWSNVGFKS